MLQDEYEIMYAQELKHWWFRGRRRVLVDLIRRQASVCKAPLRILDFGCGTGGNLASYARVGSVVGVEPDPRAVQLAATRTKIPLIRGSGTYLPFRSSSFDVVIASDVLEHIDDDARAVAEIAGVLRPGGAFIFTVPAHPWLFGPHDRALLHYRRYVERDLRALMQKEGLQISRMSYWNTLLFPLLAPLRVLGRLKMKRTERSEVKVPSTIVNELLTEVLALEAALLRWTRLPWGLSLLGVAIRP